MSEGSESAGPPTSIILDAYFPSVKILRAYLEEVMEGEEDDESSVPSFDLIGASDSTTYNNLINTSYIAIKSSESLLCHFKWSAPRIKMAEVIEQAQDVLLKSRRSQNIITLGYRQSSRSGELGKKGGRVGITNYCINTIVTALQAPEWETLLSRIGFSPMLHLLTETSIFISLPNECFCQLTGDPVFHMIPSIFERKQLSQPVQPQAKNKKRKLLEPHVDERPAKHPRLILSKSPSAKNGVQMVQSSPADIPFVRARLFYSKPVRVPNTDRLVVGLPPKHILNRFHCAYDWKKPIDIENYQDPDPKETAMNSRKLSKYVFPRQYLLESPFSSTIWKKQTFKFPEYIDREKEIEAKGRCKTPKRLRDVLALLEKLIWRHGKCGYKPLRDKVCPSKIINKDKEKLDKNIILELMSEHASQIRSQASLADGNMSTDTIGNIIFPRGLTQAEKHCKVKPRFIEFACSHIEVYRYAVLVTDAVVPQAFWGNRSNFKLIQKRLKDFIRCGRYETLTLHYILQGFSTSACDWLMPPCKGPLTQSRVSVTDAIKRRELLEDFLFWYFDGFILPLLKTTFYVTDSSALRNQILYFRQDDWVALCAPLLARLASGTFEKIIKSEADALLKQRKLGYSFVRLLPKETGVRPIVNLSMKRRRQGANGNHNYESSPSINQILQGAFHILSYEKQTRSGLLGASVFGPNDVYAKLKEFKSRLTRRPVGKMPKLYFVKVDVQACFDTIEQSKLLEILWHLISEDVYTIQRYGKVTFASGKSRRTFARRAIPVDEQPHFLTYAAELAAVLRKTIFVDQVTYPMERKEEILALLEEHITENIVKIGNDYFRQTVGIPQGSILSTLLCSFLYGDLEKQFFRFSQDPQSVLLRLIDDYLYITTSLPKARDFLQMMNKGHPEYGCFISREKTATNFDHDVHIMNTFVEQDRFPWCGFLIHTSNLSVTADYARYAGLELKSTLTVDRGRKAGATFVTKMLRLSKARSHVIYCDTKFNSQDIVYLNVYQNFLLSAMKMHAYIRTWGINPSKNTRFFYNTVQGMISYSYSYMRSNVARKSAFGNAGRCDLQKFAVFWLGTHAFYTVLSRKPHQYQSLVKSLRFKLSQSEHRRYEKRFRTLIVEGLTNMEHIF